MNEAARREILTQTLEAVSDEPVSQTLKQVLEERQEGNAEGDFFQSLLSEVDGFGPIEIFMKDPAVSEILLNSSQDIFIERAGILERVDSRFTTETLYDRFVKRMLYKIDKAADRRHPFADGTLPDGSRVHVAMPPVTKNPTVSIRRHTYSHWTLDDLRNQGSLTAATHEYLKKQLAEKKNVLIAGATGTGKTTLLRSMLTELPLLERVVTVEDSDEIGLPTGRGVALLTRPSPDDVAPPIVLRDLIRHALRMRPDRIVVGEIRGEEALIFLEAASTGHGGCLSSIHGGTAHEALARLEGLVSRAAPQWPITALRRLIYDSVDTVVCLSRMQGKRVVSEIAEMSGLEDFGYLLDERQP